MVVLKEKPVGNRMRILLGLDVAEKGAWRTLPGVELVDPVC